MEIIMNNSAANVTKLQPHNSTCAVLYYGSTFQTFKIIVDVYIVGALCVVGIFGNVMSFCVLRRMSGCSAPRLLQALSAADTGFLLTCLVFQTLRVIFFYFPSAPMSLFPYVEVWVWPVAAITQTTAVYLVVLVTVDRWRAVCFPLKTQKSRHRPRNTRICILVVILFAVLFNIPTFLDMEVRWIVTTCRMEARASWLYTNPYYNLIYKTILCFLFRTLLPLLTVIVLNVKLIISIRTTSRQELGLRNKARDKHGLNVLISVVVSVFILCSTPDFVFRIVNALELYSPTFLPLDMSHLAYMATITNLLLTLNSSSNFFIYYLTGTKFRQMLQQTCGCKNKHEYSAINVTVESKLTSSPANSKKFIMDKM